jgi:hypothetical protein
MSFLECCELVLLIGPILVLFGLGLALTLRSGVSGWSLHALKRLGWNLSRTAALVVGYLIGLAVVQRVVGFHLDMP